MRPVIPLRWLSLLTLLAVLAGCQTGAKTTPPAAAPTGEVLQYRDISRDTGASYAAPAQAPAAKAANGVGGGAGGASGPVAEGPKAAPAATAAPAAKAADPAQANNLAALAQVDRDIIKTAQLQMSVDDVDRAIDRVIALTAELRGFILDQRTQEAGAKRTATVVLRVPVNTFEEALRRLAELPGGRLDGRQISSQDVTDQLVDMESRRRNLEATEARIRTFLDQAKTVEEALRVNQQLAEVQRQLEEIRGRMEFTKNRAALSTITLDLRVIQPTPTVTPTPTPTPVPGWNPGDTARDASRVTVSLVQRLADAAIWTVVVGLPLAVPLLLVLGLAALWRRSLRGQSGKTAPQPGGNLAEPGD